MPRKVYRYCTECSKMFDVDDLCSHLEKRATVRSEQHAIICHQWDQINSKRKSTLTYKAPPAGMYTGLPRGWNGMVRTKRDVQRLHDNFNRANEAKGDRATVRWND